MAQRLQSTSPTILLRISDGTSHMHRSFTDFGQASHRRGVRGCGFHSVNDLGDRSLPDGLEPRGQRVAV